MYVCMYVCIYIHMNIYIDDTHTESNECLQWTPLLSRSGKRSWSGSARPRRPSESGRWKKGAAFTKTAAGWSSPGAKAPVFWLMIIVIAN